MRAAWQFASLYLYRLLHRPATVLFLLAVPFTLAGIEYAVFGPSKAPAFAPSTQIALVDDDNSPQSGRLAQCLRDALGPDEVQVQQFSSMDAGRHAFRDGGFGALVVIPRNYEKRMGSGEASAVEFYPNAASGAAVAENLLETCTNRQMAGVAAGPFRNVAVQRADPVADPAPVTSSAFFASILPGLAIFGVLFLSQTMAGILWRDRHSVSQMRLWCMPIHSWTIALGGLLYMTVGIVGAILIMGVFAHFVLGVELPGVSLLVLIAVGFALCAAGAQVVLGALTKSERGAQGVSSVAILMLALLGGVFVPIDQYPAALRGLAHAMPNGAALAGIHAVINGAGKADASIPLLTVWAWAATLAVAGLFAGSRRAGA